MSEAELNIRLLTGIPGNGKTAKIRREILGNKGLYLYAAPTTNLIEEQHRSLCAEPQNIHVEAIHSKTKGQGRVTERLMEAKKAIENANLQHAVLLTTHESILSNELPCFAGWHVYIDESINALRSGVITRSFGGDILSSNFDLDLLESNGWSELKPRINCPRWQDLERDDSSRAQAEFYRLAFSGRGVFVKATSLQSAGPLQWVWVWSPLSLKGAASVTLAGAAFKSSVEFKVWKRHFAEALSITEEPVSRSRPGCPTVRIHSFTEAHEGSTTFWDTSEGRHCLNQIVNYLANDVPGLGFWSANEVAWKYMEHRTPGKRLPPKVAGLNEYADLTSCALIYSAKPTPDDAPIQDLFGIANDELLEAREAEDIAQFIYRGAVRSPTFSGAFDIYLYSHRQAEQLRARLISDGVVADAELVPIHAAGIMEFKRSESASPSREPITDAERRQRDCTRKREKRALAARLTGRKPGLRGRPKKH